MTTLARTVLDVAEGLTDRRLARTVNDARLKQRSVLHQLQALMARSPGRATARIKALTTHAGAPTKSVFEDAFLAFVDHHDLPRPEVNEEVAGHEVDMLWRERRLVIELDSRAHHDTPQAFETDRARDADLLIAGFSVARLTWHRFTTEPAQVRALISRT